MFVNKCEHYSLLNINTSCYMDDFVIQGRDCAVMQVVMKSQQGSADRTKLLFMNEVCCFIKIKLCNLQN